MIVDVHSHAWAYPLHFGDDFRQQAKRARAGVEGDLTVRYDAYLARCRSHGSLRVVTAKTLFR